MTIQTIPARELFDRRQNGQTIDLIDVRTPPEFEQIHAHGARLIPLDQLDPIAVLAARTGTPGAPLFVICKSGGRAAKACEKFQAAGFGNVFSVEGGTAAWEQAGLPVVRGSRKTISLERQVRIAAGILILLGTALAFFIHRAFLALPAFIGAGLLFSGITDTCGMAMILAKMPWNRRGANCS